MPEEVGDESKLETIAHYLLTGFPSAAEMRRGDFILRFDYRHRAHSLMLQITKRFLSERTLLWTKFYRSWANWKWCASLVRPAITRLRT